MSQARVVLDGETVAVRADATIIEVARMVGIEIPTLCFVHGVEPYASCLVCMVRDETSGALVPACSTRVRDGIEITTDDEQIRASRRAAIELLLSEHVGECLAPCRRACPAGLDVPGLMDRVSAGDLVGAAELARRDLVLPASIGLVCIAPCERGCRRKDLDEPLSVCDAHRLVAEHALGSGAGLTGSGLEPETSEDREPVVFVGAGPAGLAAAWQLAVSGHRSVVYDSGSRPGGSLRAHVPAALLEAEVAVVTARGVEVRPGVRVGRDLSWHDALAGSSLLILATGADGATEEKVNNELRPFREAAGSSGSGQGPRLLTAGAACRGCRLAAQAIAHGRSVAMVAAGLLISGGPAGPTELPGVGGFSSRLPRLEPHELTLIGRRPEPRSGIERPDEPELDSRGEIVTEAQRCLQCGCAAAESCKLRRYAVEYRASARAYASAEPGRPVPATRLGPLVHDVGLCIRCGLCVRISERESQPAGLCFIGRGSTTRVGAPLGEADVRLDDEVVEMCAEACPTGALRLGPSRRPGPAGPGDRAGDALNRACCCEDHDLR